MGFIYLLAYNLAEPKAYDFMVKHFLTEKLPFDNHKQVYGSDDIVLVVIDDKTVDKYRWPWKREKIGEIFEYFLNYAQPKAIIYDAIIVANDTDNPKSDKKFFSILNKFDNLTVGILPNVQPWSEDKRDFGQKYDKLFEKYSINVKDYSSEMLPLYESLLPMPEDCYNAVKKVGSVSMIPGPINGSLSPWSMDEIFRNNEYLFKYNGKYYPSLALSTFLTINNNPQITLNNKYIEFPDLNYKIKQVKSSYRYSVPVRYYKLYDSLYSHIKYSALDIMDSNNLIKSGKNPIINPNEFKDKIVIIGANVPAGTGLNDNKNSPLRSNHPGVDYQATALDNLMHNDFLCIVPQWLNLILTLFGMFLIYLCIKRYELVKASISTITIVTAYLFVCVTCAYYKIILNAITPAVMLIMTTIIAYTHKYLIENKNKEKVKSAMGKYMSEDVMKNIVKDIDNLGLGGKRAVVTVLFSDIRGFTSMSEKMSAQEVSEFLNEYFNEMEPIVTQYNGIINKFIGDAIMAVFGEPIQDKNHSQNAVKCGYAMLKKVEKLQKKWEKQGKPIIDIGIGINTGEVFVGNIGSVNRMEYTVIGDTVNLASRLESYNKMYRTKMLIGATTYKDVKNIADVLKIPEVRIRGKANKIDIYEVLKVKLDN